MTEIFRRLRCFRPSLHVRWLPADRILASVPGRPGGGPTPASSITRVPGVGQMPASGFAYGRQQVFGCAHILCGWSLWSVWGPVWNTASAGRAGAVSEPRSGCRVQPCQRLAGKDWRHTFGVVMQMHVLNVCERPGPPVRRAAWELGGDARCWSCVVLAGPVHYLGDSLRAVALGRLRTCFMATRWRTQNPQRAAKVEIWHAERVHAQRWAAKAALSQK